MNIKLIGKIFPPETELRSGGPALPAVLSGEITVTLTPKILREMLMWGRVTIPGLCDFELRRDQDGWFRDIRTTKKGPVCIEVRSGYLLAGSKKEVADRIRKLLKRKEVKLLLTRKQNEDFEYPIDDLFPA
ncbi:MAG: hypothetical protein RLZZ517_558 [Candidatus Parcubacteria bacterium]|jgi:alkanesulfonate monooxygenase SsuD/methylene tetrahydromethanopterin reductase-like flavin-dependent oxidoreductase (luciferase family)